MLCYVESRLFNKTLMFSRICKDDSICYGNFLSSKYKIQIVESFIKSTESCCPLMNYVKAAYWSILPSRMFSKRVCSWNCRNVYLFCNAKSPKIFTFNATLKTRFLIIKLLGAFAAFRSSRAPSAFIKGDGKLLKTHSIIPHPPTSLTSKQMKKLSLHIFIMWHITAHIYFLY